MKYRIGIDETGDFNINSENSFVCAVLTKSDDKQIKTEYKKCYEEMYGSPVPDDLIGGEKFHYSKLTKENKDICGNNLFPLVEKIFCSKGKPALFANNQNWWLVAQVVVISELLEQSFIKKSDEIEIYIDNRKDCVWGISENAPEFKAYHNFLEKQIKEEIKPIESKKGITVNIFFRSDTSNYYINLADIVCGIVRNNQNAEKVKQKLIEVSCRKYKSNNDPYQQNGITALNLLFQEFENKKFNHIELLEAILPSIIKSDEYRDVALDSFYDFVKNIIEERKSGNELSKIKPIIDCYQKVVNNNKEKIKTNKLLEFTILVNEYYSHIGSIHAPYTEEDFLSILKKNDEKSETRLLRKWENYVSFNLRKSQIEFNGYNFQNVIKVFEKIWETQENISNGIHNLFNLEKDEPTTAIIGTLAQAYAYNGGYDEAIEYFNLSKKYSIKSSSKTASYLFSIYHRKEDIENARKMFLEQVKMTPEEYLSKNDFHGKWNLLSYCKLRTLELYKNNKTELKHIDLEKLELLEKEYPVPLILKWEGISLYLEDRISNKDKIEKYFISAISNLISKDNEFAIKTLSLPIIQCYSKINNQNSFHSQYNNILNELKKESNTFEKFINENCSIINTIKNDGDILACAVSLPFIYS